MLLWFFIVLLIGVVMGGWIVIRVGDCVVVFVGLFIVVYGYWFIFYWLVDLLVDWYNIFGLFIVLVMYIDLVVVGLGLGLVIGLLLLVILWVVLLV